MKRLIYLRHGQKNPDGTLSPEGEALAQAQGAALARENWEFTHAFHGPLPRTEQTESNFFRGYNLGGFVNKHEPIMEIGFDEWFAEILTDEFKAKVKEGLSNFDVLLEIHTVANAMRWARTAEAGVKMMLQQIPEGETGIAFGHSPVIELAAWQIAAFDLEFNNRRLAELEGFLFKIGIGDMTIDVLNKISTPAVPK